MGHCSSTSTLLFADSESMLPAIPGHTASCRRARLPSLILRRDPALAAHAILLQSHCSCQVRSGDNTRPTDKPVRDHCSAGTLSRMGLWAILAVADGFKMALLYGSDATSLIL